MLNDQIIEAYDWILFLNKLGPKPVKERAGRIEGVESHCATTCVPICLEPSLWYCDGVRLVINSGKRRRRPCSVGLWLEVEAHRNEGGWAGEREDLAKSSLLDAARGAETIERRLWLSNESARYQVTDSVYCLSSAYSLVLGNVGN